MPYKDLDKRRECVRKSVSKHRKTYGYDWWNYSPNSRLTSEEHRVRANKYMKERDELMDKRANEKLDVRERKLITNRISLLGKMIKGHLQMVTG